MEYREQTVECWSKKLRYNRIVCLITKLHKVNRLYYLENEQKTLKNYKTKYNRYFPLLKKKLYRYFVIIPCVVILSYSYSTIMYYQCVFVYFLTFYFLYYILLIRLAWVIPQVYLKKYFASHYHKIRIVCNDLRTSTVMKFFFAFFNMVILLLSITDLQNVVYNIYIQYFLTFNTFIYGIGKNF